MALTFTQITQTPEFFQFGNLKGWLGQIQFDSSYPTGGESIPITQQQTFGMLGILGIFCIGVPDATGGSIVISWNYATLKLMAFRSGGFTPAGTIAKPTFTVTKGAILASSELGLSADATSATVNNNTIAATLTLLAANSPVGAPAFTGTAVAAAGLVEVANATDLSTVTQRVFVIGR